MVVGIVAGGACCILVALLSYFANLNDVRPVFATSLALMGVRIAASAVPVVPEALALLSQLSAGLAWMLILLCWMQVFASYRPVYSVPMIAAGYIIDLAVVPLANALFPEGRQGVFFVALVLSVAALAICLACNRSVANNMLDGELPRSSLKELVVRTKLILFVIFLVAVPCGFVIQSDILDGIQYVQADLTAFMGIGVSLVLLVLLVVFRPQKKTIDLAYPVSIVCLVLVLLYRVFAGRDGYLSGSIMAAFLMTFFGVFWITFIREAHERRLPAFFLLGLAVGVAQLSLAMGRLAALAAQGSIVAQDQRIMVACAVSFLALGLCVVVIVGMIRFEKMGFHPNEEIAAQASSTPASTVVSIAALDLLKESYGLSKREFQVITEFSTGRSARYIADALMLSEYTIKSHLRRAYAKMDVHSRQELLSLIDRMEAELHTCA